MNYVVAVIILMALLIVWIFAEQKLLVTKQYCITSDKLDKAFDRTKFIVLADLHNHTFGIHNERLLRKIDSQTPDFIIVAGDIITMEERCIPGNSVAFMQKLAEKYTVYYAYGNHEQDFENHVLSGEDMKHDVREKQKSMALYSTWIEYKNRLKNSGIIFLDNQSVIRMKNGCRLTITGVSLPLPFYKRGRTTVMQNGYLDTLLGKKQDNGYQILIAHNPMYFKNYVEWGADLILSGHVHGGLVRLPFLGGVISPQIRLFPKYDAGNFSEHGQNMIVSRGLGSHSIMFRLFNPAELVCVLLMSNDVEISDYSTMKGEK
jgi:predicted MPP superfamily phosphohydrolase